MTDDVRFQRQTDTKNAWICSAVVAAAMLITWPVAEMPFGDDAAYTHIALGVARTGHLAYNGWETTLLVLNAYWGAFFIRLFGFSFNCVRFSTIPFSLGTTGFCYLLVRRAGLQARLAVFVTILFGLCPLFLPLSVTFMTDVPALFFVFASLYSLARAAEASATYSGYAWLALGLGTGFLGGTGRQVVWLVPLVVLPYLAWVRRGQVWFAGVSLAAWILMLGGVVEMTAWFNRQLYIVGQPSISSELKLALKHPLLETNLAARLSLMLVLMILPAALPLAMRSSVDTWRGPRVRQVIVAALFLALGSALLIHPSLASIPWIASTLNREGINGSAPLPGRPIVLVRPIRALVAIVVYSTVCILAGEVLDIRRLTRRTWQFLLDPPGSQFALAAMSVFSLVYFILAIIRGVEFDIFDRYLLPMLPWAASVLLLWFQADCRAERVLRWVMPYAWTVLTVLALYAIASTQDFWALARARAAAARKLEVAGIPRTAIDGGFEYNAWTELMMSGRMNSRWVTNPVGTYRAGLSQTPSVVPFYRLEYEPTQNTSASQFGSVAFLSFLPPFRKRVCIDRVADRQSVQM